MKKLKALFSHKGTGRGSLAAISTIGPGGEPDHGYYNPKKDEFLDDDIPAYKSNEDYNANIGLKEDDHSAVELYLLPCNSCGRTFLPESLVKHTAICQKTAAKKRKQFDSSRQRREGTEIAQFLPKNFGLPEHSPFLEKEKPPQIMPRASTRTKQPSPRTSHSKLLTTPDNAKCPHCGRGFGARAWDRHVAWCAERAKLAVSPGASAGPEDVRVARSRLIARTSYRAPAIKSRRSLTREKYSLSRSASVDSGVSDRSSGTGDHHRPSRDTNENVQHLPIIKKTSRSSNDDVVNTMSRSFNVSRFDDNSYDPFLSAKRQMLDLMSSSTNLHKMDTNPIEHKKDPSLFPVTSHPLQHTPRKIKEENLTNNNVSPNLQRTRSLRSPSNKYNPAGKNIPSKPTTNTLSNSTYSNKTLNHSYSNNNDKQVKSNASSPKYKSSNSKADNKQHSRSPNGTSDAMSKFPNRTEKHRIIKLEPVEKISNPKTKADISKNISNNNAIKNNLYSQDSFIDPKLINDKIPPSVQKLLDNPVLLSSTESLVGSNPPKTLNQISNKKTSQTYSNNFQDYNNSASDNEDSTTPTIDDLSAQYDKIMVSLEQTMNSKMSPQDEDALYNDLEELMSSLDDDSSPLHLGSFRKSSTKSRTTKDCLDGLNLNNKKNNTQNSLNTHSPLVKQKQVPYNKSISLNFSSLNNPHPNPVYPMYMKRSNSIHDSKDKKHSANKNGDQYKEEECQLEDDIIRSLKDIDRLCDGKVSSHTKYDEKNKKVINYKYDDISIYKKTKKGSSVDETSIATSPFDITSNESRETSPENYTYQSKPISDSAYGRSSLNRTSPSTQQVLRASPSRKTPSPSPPPIRGTTASIREPIRASRRSPQRDHTSPFTKEDSVSSSRRSPQRDYISPFTKDDSDASMRRSPQREYVSPFNKEDSLRHSRRSPQRDYTSPFTKEDSMLSRAESRLSSSGSDASLPSLMQPISRTCSSIMSTSRLSKFCHECGSKFPFESAKFCIECGARRLAV